MSYKTKETKKWRGMKNVYKKIISLFLALAISVTFLPSSSSAYNMLASPDYISQSLDEMLSKFGAEYDTVTETTQKMNVLSKKMTSPEVFVTFEPTNPVPGDKVSATAQPMNFGNQGDTMYFTWFLQTRDCPPGDDNLEKCDLNEDGTVDIEDYKIKAMRIIASDDFEGSDEDDSDNDGYRAVIGGDDQRNVGEEAHCFFHDTVKGGDYEFQECRHLFPNAPGETTGDNSFGKGEETFWQTDPTDSDTADVGNTDEANVSGLGQKTIKWTYQEGDKVGVAIEGISFMPTDYDDASYKAMWALTKNTCEKIDNAFRDPSEDNGETITVDPPYWPDCPDGCQFQRAITRETTEYSQAPSSSYEIAKKQKNIITQMIQLSSRKYTAGEAEGGTGGSGGSGGSGESEGESEGGGGGSGGSGGSVSILPGTCPFVLPEQSACYTADGISEGSEIVDQSCCTEGVPGTTVSEASEECPLAQASCAVLSSDETTTPIESSEDPGKTADEGNLFEMTMADFNDCLMQNFIDPTEGGGKFKKINVSLSYSPKNLINDPTGNISDKIKVESAIDNANDSQFLYYKWEVFGGESTDGPWEAISRESLDGVGETMGLGAKNLEFNLKFPENITYLKVKLTVSESAYNGERKGHSDIIIPIASHSSSFEVYDANISDTQELSPGERKCLLEDQQINEPVCQVAKNQILGVRVNDENLTDFLWQIGNEKFTYKYNPDGTATNPAFFPVTKDVGEDFTVSVSATNRETGEKVNLSQAFKVVDPKITIISQDEGSAVPTLKGFYTDTDNVAWPDYSQTEFETLQGSNIDLRAEFTAATPLDDSIEWFVDGAHFGTGQTLSFPADKPVGSSYDITVKSLYTQDNNMAKALSKYWDISYDGLYEKTLSGSITAKTVGAVSTGTSAKNNVKKFLASLVVGFPSYLSFLFRITLTTALLLFTYRVIFILLPNAKREEI